MATQSMFATKVGEVVGMRLGAATDGGDGGYIGGWSSGRAHAPHSLGNTEHCAYCLPSYKTYSNNGNAANDVRTP